MANTDNQEVDSDKKKKKGKKAKNKDEDIDNLLSDDGKVRPSKDLDKIMMKDMSRCAGYAYFRNESNEY